MAAQLAVQIRTKDDKIIIIIIIWCTKIMTQDLHDSQKKSLCHG